MVATTQTPNKIYTIEEYFEIEKTSPIKHEFVNGKLIPMPGEAREANEIATNLVVLMKPSLRKKGFKIYDHDVRTIVKENKIYRYPDVVVTHITDDSDRYHVKQPILIVEVASEDSAKTDREIKLEEYSKLESVQYYLIIDQNLMRVEMYSRSGNRWYYDQFTQPTDIVELPLLEQNLLLADIYEDVFKIESPKED
jgi:Uma2 family endonuclease